MKDSVLLDNTAIHLSRSIFSRTRAIKSANWYLDSLKAYL